MNDWSAPLLAIALLAAVPTAFAGLLRWAGMKAGLAAIIAGIIGGVLLGPVVLGRVRPEIHERLFLGGVEARQRLDHLIRMRGAELLAAQKAGVPATGLGESERIFQRTVASAERSLADGRFRDQLWLRVYSTILATAIVGAIAWALRRVASPGVRIARWIAPSLIAATLVRIDLEHIAPLPIIAALAAQLVLLLFVRPCNSRRATWVCPAIMCGLAAWNLGGELVAVMLVLVALLTEAMDVRATVHLTPP